MHFAKLSKIVILREVFLIALLELNEEDIADLEVIDPFEEGESEEEKQTELYDWVRLLAAKDWGEVELTKKVFKLYQKGYSVEQIAKECSMEVSKIQEILS